MTEFYTARRAFQGEPVSVDREARTVDVVWSTGARARNYVPQLGSIVEELDMSPKAVRMDKLKSGSAPVLDTHNKWNARSVLGRVTAASLSAGRGTATIKFSEAKDVEDIWARVADGSLRSISVGYHVHRYEQINDPTTGRSVYRAVDWEPYEISVVPVPVDPDAAVRGDMGYPAPEHSQPNQENAMTTQPAPGAPATAPATDPIAHDAARGAPSAAPTQPAATTPAPTPAPASAPAAVDVEAVERAMAERIASYEPVLSAARGMIPEDRIATIRQAAIMERVSVDVLRGRLWEALSTGTRPSVPAQPTTGPSNDDPAVIREAMAEAIAVRAMAGRYESKNPRHAEFAGWRPLDLAYHLLAARGERNLSRNPAIIAERAFHTTSDFPLLLSAAANKMLLATYAVANPTYRMIFMRRDFKDFKAHRFLRAGDFPTLQPLGENGEIQAGTISESQELVSLQTFARRVRVTRQMLVNDDLGAFTDFASMIGRRVSDFENATAYGVLNQNSGAGPTLVQGATTVFGTGASRLNQAAAGTALDIANVGLGRAAMMRQKTLDGLPIAVGNEMRLLVGPNLEMAARQITVAVPATQISNVNPWAGFLQPVIEPLIINNRWYLFADPASAPVYIYGYLNGAEGPQVTTGPVQGVDGVEVQVIFDFAAGAVDYRGGWFNQGT